MLTNVIQVVDTLALLRHELVEEDIDGNAESSQKGDQPNNLPHERPGFGSHLDTAGTGVR